MIDIQDITTTVDITLKAVMQIFNTSSKQIVLVVDEKGLLIGTVNDGDIRRALLKGIGLDDSIKDVYYKKPTVANVNDSKEKIIRLALSKKIHQIPLVDNNGKLVGLDNLDELVNDKRKTNKVILMVGGLGSRLKPLTNDIPKPMLYVGDKPILQTIIENFLSYGFDDFVLCVNYKSEVIRDYFGDGSAFGAKIEYVLEQDRMGTAGALSLLDEKLTEPFFVMNGDLLTNVNFEHLLDFHQRSQATGTMCVREYDFQVPYGVVSVENGKITSVEEKPTHKFFVSAGIYMLEPKCINLIPKGQFYDMPMLFGKLIEERSAVSFPLHEYWLDIGRVDEFEKANQEYHGVFM